MPPLKAKADRVKEAITILRKLKDLGIPQTNDSYLETKRVLDIWIADGLSSKTEIPFVRFGRIGYLGLPSVAKEVATFQLKATPELKEYIDRMEEEKKEEQTSS